MNEREPSAWQQQQQAMLDRISREAAAQAKSDWLKLRAQCFAKHFIDQLSKRQVLDRLQTKYEKLRAPYLKLTGTTYAGWTEHGPQLEWQEVLAAARDDSVWDRLVERVIAETAPVRKVTRASDRAVEATPAQVADLVKEIAPAVLSDFMPEFYTSLIGKMSDKLAERLREELERRAR